MGILMETLDGINKKIQGSVGLKSIVRTMKIIAAVNIRSYEQLRKSLIEYQKTIELGLQIVLKHFSPAADKNHQKSEKTGALIFGSDMGMCGQFNEQICSFSENQLSDLKQTPILAIGNKILLHLENLGVTPIQKFNYPANLTGNINPVLQDLLIIIDKWRQTYGIRRINLIYNKPSKSGISYNPFINLLMPVDPDYFDELRNRVWVSNSIPKFKMDKNKLFAELIKNHFYITLYMAFADSLTSENAARLTSMQAAEKHIDEHLQDLTLQYNQERQNSITNEILDILAGSEAVKT